MQLEDQSSLSGTTAWSSERFLASVEGYLNHLCLFKMFIICCLQGGWLGAVIHSFLLSGGGSFLELRVHFLTQGIV